MNHYSQGLCPVLKDFQLVWYFVLHATYSVTEGTGIYTPHNLNYENIDYWFYSFDDHFS